MRMEMEKVKVLRKKENVKDKMRSAYTNVSQHTASILPFTPYIIFSTLRS